ncbi:hypothetical protein GCM10007049_01500 [Echinicola pacifica]|uniref:RNA polymerase sigma factor 70 region 4 type 2 domain-containing protein n=1 Tax=Echinicola pacifica TaxID=346377 RepID=A0A918PL72_9BACT|nr:sigma-70 family RNA polymerase sigma factor [Echinicola pacifica]GGZ13398.1 hypothetical protein GCM10007049_01500 [Echinicola pacifica]
MLNNLKENNQIVEDKPNVEKSQVSDLELWRAFKEGSNSAFIKIYETYFEALFRFGSRITPHEELIKDAIHDVFFDLRKNSKSIGETKHIKFYLFKCLKRKIVKELNNWTVRQEELTEHTPFEIIFSHEHFLINSQLDSERSAKVKEAIMQLSSRKREAIYYLYFENLSYDEVSEMMGLASPKSARDLIYKALKSLRNSLGFLPLFLIPPL